MIRTKTSSCILLTAFASLLVLTVLVATVAKGAVVTSATGGLWSDGSTWSGGSAPGAMDDVIIASGHTVTNSGVEFVTINSLVVSGVLTHEDNSAAETHKICLDVAGDVTVSQAGVMTADYLGYDGTKGPGVGINEPRAGAGHGGTGGDANVFGNGTGGPCYGSVYAPTNCGSGGSLALHSGGGAIIIKAGGTVTVDGLISANARPADSTGNNYSGGSGGSVFITAGSFRGTGAISANGGSRTTKYGAGGGGGRIAVVVTDASGFGDVSMQVFGGRPATSGYYGGAGTIYTKEPGQVNGTLLLNNNGQPNSGTSTIPAGQTWEFDVINVISQGVLMVQSGTTLNIASNEVLGDGTGDVSGRLANRGTLNTPASFVVTNCTLVADQMGVYPTLQNLTISANGVMSHTDNSTTESYRIDLAIPGNFTVHAGGKVNVDFLGYDKANGPGYKGSFRAGGSHGGMGSAENAMSGPTYGSIFCPTNLGSGGVSGVGGGAVRLTVDGTARIDGTVSANGQLSDKFLGGGSGGSVCISARKFMGSGLVEAEGAYFPSATYAGGSGGGRVALIATETRGLDNIIVEVFGGAGAGHCIDAGAGTFYYQAPDDASGTGTVQIKNIWTSATPCTLPAMLDPVENIAKSLWVLEDKSFLQVVEDAQVREMYILTETAKLDLAGKTLTVDAFGVTNTMLRTGIHTAESAGTPLVVDSIGGGMVIVRGNGSLMIIR